jgi:hypothetical protein
MLSFRNARPSNLPPDMAILANQMDLSRPVSLRKLIDYLNAPTAVQFNSAGLAETSGIAASATWTLNAQGFWNFQGKLNNSNAITQQWAIGMVLPVQGQKFWTHAGGQVGPNLPLGNNNASWNYTGFEQTIVDFWPEIFGANLQSATALTNLQVSINVGDALAAVGIYLGAAGGALGVVSLVAAAALLGPNGEGWTCGDPQPVPGDGIGVQWTCQ